MRTKSMTAALPPTRRISPAEKCAARRRAAQTGRTEWLPGTSRLTDCQFHESGLGLFQHERGSCLSALSSCKVSEIDPSGHLVWPSDLQERKKAPHGGGAFLRQGGGRAEKTISRERSRPCNTKIAAIVTEVYPNLVVAKASPRGSVPCALLSSCWHRRTSARWTVRYRAGFS